MVSPDPQRPLAFLCHSSGDKERVRELHRRLKRDGHNCWLDEEELIPGQNWEQEINRALRRSDYIIVCLSQSSITKRGFVQKELKAALDIAAELPEGEIFLIPVRLEVCEPPDRLRTLQWVDLFGDTGYRQLTRALQTRGISNATVPASAWNKEFQLDLKQQQRRLLDEHETTAASVFNSYRRLDAAGMGTVETDGAYIGITRSEVEEKLRSEANAGEKEVVEPDSNSPLDLMQLTPVEFEDFVRQLLEASGLDSWMALPNSDGFTGLMVKRDPLAGDPTIISAKRYRTVVGLKDIREVIGGLDHAGTVRGMVITTSWFSAGCWRLAQKNGRIELIDGPRLRHLACEHLGIDVIIAPKRTRTEKPPDEDD